MGGFDALVEYECIGASVVVYWLATPLTREEFSVRHCAALESRCGICQWDSFCLRLHLNH